MRLSDILKKAKGQTAPPAPSAPQTPSTSFHLPAEHTPSKETTPTADSSKQAAPPSLSAEDAYTKAIIEIKNILACVQKDETFNGKIESVASLIEHILANNDDILMLIDRSTPDIYLYGHSVNVTILSLLMGQALSLDPASLNTLGLAALLHDLGLAKNMSIALKSGKLTAAEFEQIKKHSMDGCRLLEKVASLSTSQKEEIASIILQIHERKDGSGYPVALKGGDITAYAHIIAIADVYETMSHPRPYHERTIPHEALKSMIASTKSDYDAEIMKLFIGRLSLYPPGSYVKLNSDDIGRVIGINPGLPTRPTVKILIDANRNRAAEPKVIDLAATPMLFIKEAVDESKLNLADKKLALELKAFRWWVKGL